MRTLIILTLALTLSACGDIELQAVSTAPPNRLAVLDDATRTVELSHGVALAVDCTSSARTHYGPCSDMALRVDDPDVAGVLAAEMDELRERYAEGTTVDQQEQAVFVVTGRSPGTTTVRVTTEHGGATLTVIVKPVSES
jgi:hypothetical protein